MFRIFFSIISRLNLYLGTVLSWLVLVLTLTTAYDVICRKLFQSGSIALQELEWHMFAAIALLALGFTLRKDAHVRVDIFYSRLSERGKALIDLCGTLVFLIPFVGFVVWSSLPFVQAAIFPQIENSPDPGGLPYRFFIKSALPLGFLFLGIEGILFLAQSARKLFARREAEGEEK